MTPVRKAFLILRYLGLGWVIFRIRYALRRKFGGLKRRTPLRPWPNVPPAAATTRRFFLRPPAIGAGAVAEAEEILRGTVRLFSVRPGKDVGAPPSWHRNQLTGEDVPAGRHWSDYGDFAFGDIKGVWELSRFSWAFPLARAFARTGDERFAETFWRWFEDWLEHNPPNAGPSWMCGQEATFRLMAIVFAAEVVNEAGATTAARKAKLRSFLLVTGSRIAANLDYALSQSNNHGVSEAVGLITVALILPNVAEATAWRTRGLAALRRQVETLVYPDGAFAQHSANYHRVLLHDLVWATAMLRGAGVPVPEWLSAGGARATEFLAALITPETGRVPLYGANDGANVLPLSDSDYLDFRPVVQASFAAFRNERCFPPGPWDEAAEWLTAAGSGLGFRESVSGGNLPSSDISQPKSPLPNTESQMPNPRFRHFPHGGALVWRHGDTRLFLRCPTHFRHRPAQADMLHTDIEWRGQPIAIDAGTYSYNAQGHFAGALKEARVHNTVTFRDREPMPKAGRFLYLPWPRGSAAWTDEETFAASHEAWLAFGVTHERRVRGSVGDGFEIEDRLVGGRTTIASLRWLLADHPHELSVGASVLRLLTSEGPFAVAWRVPAGARVTLVRADESSVRGWCSPHYGEAKPALSLAIEFEFDGDARCTTRFSPAAS